MKTIEEQIEEFARKLTPCAMCNENSDGVGCKVEIKDCAWRKDIYKALSEVAKLQKEIDINKACQWFESYLAEIGYPDDWCRDSEVQESGEKRFRKFMDANTVDDGIKRRTSKTWVLNGKKIRFYKKLVEELKKIEI